MDAAVDRLYDLLRALFSTDEELRRFLVLEQIVSDESLGPAQKAPNREATAYNTARTLSDRGWADARLFDALYRRAPERVEDIRSVARLYLPAREEPVGEGQEKPPAPTTRDGDTGFVARLEAELLNFEDAEMEPSVMDSDRWPWAAAAAVLGSFRPLELQPLPVNPPSSMSALQALAAVVFTSFDGSWVLEDRVRITCLRRLKEQGQLHSAVQANEEASDARRDLFRRALGDQRTPWLGALGDQRTPRLGALTGPELTDFDAVIGWLEAVEIDVGVSRSALAAAMERRWLIDPLRSLVGTHFRGRSKELAVVRKCVDGSGLDQVLFIRGPGGAGKSTLLGKVLLDLEDHNRFVPAPFVYIDFDKALHDPRDTTGLLRQVARQLRLLYATSAEEASGFAAVEAFSAGTDLERAAEILDIPVDLDFHSLIQVLADRLLSLHGDQPPLVMVLDTCEEVLAKGPGAVRDLVGLVDRLMDSIPGMRLITAGRSVISQFGAARRSMMLTLGDLDPEAADALLGHVGVGDGALRHLIIARFGGNPLTLRLAAEALSRAGVQAAFSGVEVAKDLAEVSLEQVQGMLYARILGHIRDREVAAVAHPGLAVRSITVPVLRDVLAIPCGFAPAIAADLFERLRTEVSMFERQDAHTLRHRQDVRRLMLKTMHDDPRRAGIVVEIHRRAASFYAALEGAQSRAEEVYHRLMSGEDPRALDRLWHPGLGALLEDALEEPLPGAARRWLSRRLRVDDTGVERVEWEQTDWEAHAASVVGSWLASNAPADALSVLWERRDRLPASPLYALEVQARMGVGDDPGAALVLEEGLRSANQTGSRASQLDLSEQAVILRERQQDWAGLHEAVSSCLALTDLTGERARGLRVLTNAIPILREVAPARAAALGDELNRRFTKLSYAELRADPDLARRAVHAAVDDAVLLYTAHEVGDRTDEKEGVFRDDVFALTRLLESTRSSAAPALAALATEVGLTIPGWTIADLASRAARTGRTGAAIAIGLDHARSEDEAHQLVIEELTHPIDPSK